jgi:hypothetical protein
LSVEFLRLAECEIGPKRDDSIQLTVETRDALERPLDELMGRNTTRPHRVGKRVENCPPPPKSDR